MLCRKPCGWQHNLNQKVSGKTGAVHRRIPVDLDGFRLIAFGADATLPKGPGPMAIAGLRRRGG